MTQYVPHARIKWCDGVTPLNGVSRHCRLIQPARGDSNGTRRAARSLMRCACAAFSDRLVAANVVGAAARPAWNMRWPSCAANPTTIGNGA